MRVFCFADGEYEGRFGGGGKGVTYRLYMADRKYHLIPHLYCVFGDTLIEADTGRILRSEDETVREGGIRGLMAFYTALDEELHFSSEDVCIFHDFACFYALKHVAPHIDLTAAVYHGQGSLFYEAESFGLQPDEEYREKTRTLTEYVLSGAQMICFPSAGAREAFLATSEDGIRGLLDDCHGRILYNGCLPDARAAEAADHDVFKWIESRDHAGRIFVSVAVLNEAKGVERLPDFFADYGKTHDYLWIIVGNGAMGDRLKEGIERLGDHVFWIRESVPNEVIIRLYQKADYYILAHRISIFDFATIEAMHMGAVPVLSEVGGNKEMICDGNGFFLPEDLRDSSGFAAWEEQQDPALLKQKNIDIARDRFSDRSMLEAYRELAEELGSYREKRDLLLIVPDLELNGAQVVLKELLELPYFADKAMDLISPSKGAYGRIYTEKGIRVLIRPYIAGDESFREHLIRDYERVLVNTSSCNMYLMYFLNTRVPVLFWLHETFTQLQQTDAAFLDPRLYSRNIRLFGVTQDVLTGIAERFGGISADLLPMPVADVREEREPAMTGIAPELADRIRGKVLFFFPAAYTIIKGQDVLLQAILKLPAEYRAKAHFVLCGYRLPGQESYYRSLKDLCARFPEVTMLDQLPREEVYNWYRLADCVLATSRVDATPTSIVEAMMFGRIVLVSDAAGISRYLTDCVNAFVFPSENEEELMKRLMLIIHDPDQLKQMGEKARTVYEEFFSPAVVNELVEEYASDRNGGENGCG